MTTKLPSGLAASGGADETDSEQITKEHSDEIEDIVVDPSDDVTVEATEDVTSEAVAGTPPPSLRRTPVPIVGEGGTPAPLLPSQTLLGVPIQSLPLPGVTAASSSPRSDFLDEHEEVTAMAPSVVDELLARGPSITDDDEEETKVEPADAAIKAAASLEDVSTALSAQASVEREKALRRSSPPMMAPTSSDLEFEDPNQGEDEDDDDGEVLSGSAADEIEDDDDDAVDGDDDESGSEDVATGTFAKPVDSTGFSGLLNARRPPSGSPFGRDGFGSARLPTPSPHYGVAVSTAPAPATSPFSARLSPVPAGSPYGARATTSSMPAIQIPAPSAAPATTAGTGLFSRVQVPAYVLAASAIAFFGLGFGTRAMVAPSRPAQTIVVTKQVTAPPPVAPAVDPVPPSLGSSTTPSPTHGGGAEATAPKTAVIEPTTPPAIEPEPPRPVKKVAVVKRKPADDALAEEAVLRPAKLTASVSKPAPAPVAKAAPVPAAKPAKKPSKVWVDPFAQ
jgi:hypothetical protein